MRTKQPKQPNNKLSNKIERKAITLYDKGLSFKNVAKTLNIGATSVKNILLRNNVHIRNKYECQKKISFSKEFFNKKNQYLAYFWGFFLGDGSISNNNGINRVKISINKKDKEVLSLFCHWLSLDLKNIKTYNNYCEIYLRDEIFNKDLSYWGVGYNKTYNPVIPKIKNKHLLKYFILGLIDADGHVIFKQNKKYTIELVGNKKIMNWVKEILSFLGFNGKISTYSQDDKVWSRIKIHKKQDVLDLSKILNVHRCHFSLYRKWQDIRIELSNNEPYEYYNVPEFKLTNA